MKTIVAKNEKSPKPKICSERQSPDKLWVDKGREFSGNFATFCRQKGIQIYSTKSETNSALAERNIRSLKYLIFKYMHEHDQSRYCDKLDQFVAIINNRVNQMTKLALSSVLKKDVNYLVSFCHTNAQKKPKFKIGKSANKFAFDERLTLFIEVTKYNSQKNCSQLQQNQLPILQLTLLKIVTAKLSKVNFTSLNSCDSLHIDSLQHWTDPQELLIIQVPHKNSP